MQGKIKCDDPNQGQIGQFFDEPLYLSAEMIRIVLPLVWFATCVESRDADHGSACKAAESHTSYIKARQESPRSSSGAVLQMWSL